MPDNDRSTLAARQRQLVSALVRNETAIESFDANRLAVASEALFRKRRRGIEKTWPNLARSLGESFAAQFREFAVKHPSPASGGPVADGWEFACHLDRSGALPDAGGRELLAVRLVLQRANRGIVHRRGLVIAWQRLSQARRLMVGVRLPFLGERYFILPSFSAPDSR
jgi:hypothetical protein